jgi:hypothetical protein
MGQATQRSQNCFHETETGSRGPIRDGDPECALCDDADADADASPRLESREEGVKFALARMAAPGNLRPQFARVH